MGCSLGGLQCACNLGVRGREKTGDLLGEGLIRSKPGKLTLPEVEIASGKPIELARVVVFRGHDSL